MSSGCLVAHCDDLWPICVVVYKNHKVLPTIAAVINCRGVVKVVLVSGSVVLGVSRQMISALLATQDDVVDLINDSWPVNS